MTIESQPAPPAVDLGLAGGVCLALACEGFTHGWAMSRELAPGGPIGRIWSLSRPLTYRAIDDLVDRGLLERTGTAPGRGRGRRTVAPTDAGRRADREWLDEPASHPRDLRTELLVKLTLRGRRSIATLPLLRAQRDALEPTQGELERTDPGDLVALWRREQARATRRFLTTAMRAADAPGPQRSDHTDDPQDNSDARDERDADPRGGSSGGGRASLPLELSARNQLRAIVSTIALGEQVSTITATVDPAQLVSATVTRAAIDHLALVEGDPVLMITKATDTIVGALPAPG